MGERKHPLEIVVIIYLGGLDPISPKERPSRTTGPVPSGCNQPVCRRGDLHRPHLRKRPLAQQRLVFGRAGQGRQPRPLHHRLRPRLGLGYHQLQGRLVGR